MGQSQSKVKQNERNPGLLRHTIENCAIRTMPAHDAFSRVVYIPNPMSNILSASSKTRYVTLFRFVPFAFTWSIRRP